MSGLHPQSQYYLHANGMVIYKPHGGVDHSSDFVVQIWNANHIARDPASYSNWLLDLFKLGAPMSEIRRLAEAQKLLEFMPELKPEFERLGILTAQPETTE